MYYTFFNYNKKSNRTVKMNEKINDSELLKIGENILKNSKNKYRTIVKLAQQAKITKLEDFYTSKPNLSLKPLINEMVIYDRKKTKIKG